MTILIVKLGAAGDVIRTTAILPGLKEKYKKAAIDWITEKKHVDLLRGNPYLRNIFVFDDHKLFSNHKYNLIIDLDADLGVSKVISLMKTDRLFGTYANSDKLVYTKDSRPWFDLGLLSRFGKEKADILKAKNRKTYQELCYQMLKLSYRQQRPQLTLSRHDLEYGRLFSHLNNIRKGDFVVGINTGAGTKWLHKKLDMTDTIKVIEKVKERFPKSKIILLGGPEEIERNRKIKLKLPYVIDASGNQTFMQFASLINLCGILITSDSLGMHLATALNKKIIAFFSPTSPWEIELYDTGVKVLPVKGCLACYHRRCQTKPQFDLNHFIESIEKPKLI
ncbi:MAG: glycosyltransferase family 9 protein [Patescibacteria group bacterium]